VPADPGAGAESLSAAVPRDRGDGGASDGSINVDSRTEDVVELADMPGESVADAEQRAGVEQLASAEQVADIDPAIPDPSAEPLAPAVPPPPILPVVEVDWLDWTAVRVAIDPNGVRARMRDVVERMESLLDRSGGPGLMFDDDRSDPADRAINVSAVDETVPLWFIGDLHGDLLALEAALALIRSGDDGATRARIVFLGDLFDDGGYGLEVLLRVYELILDAPDAVCIVAGNHDEAFGYDGARFTASVSPSDFSEFLNTKLAHEWMVRAGKLAVRVFADAPRALFFPDGLLVAHGGFPLVDLHPDLLATGDWNDPRCLADFVWTRAHPKIRRKMPNRTSRGSQFGHEDFAAFRGVAAELGRPVTHLVRGHDHLDDRWAIYPAYEANPVLTTNALSRQLAREPFGPYERVPTVARWVVGCVPEVHRLHVPGEMIREIFPDDRTPRDEAE
jgi:hypothetical protein